MPLGRQTIREAVVGRLVGLTEIDFVHQWYAWDFATEELPAANVTTPEDEVAQDAEGEHAPTLGSVVTSMCEVHVELYAKQSAGLPAKLDRMCSEVLKKMYPNAEDHDLGGIGVSEFDYLGFTTEVSGEQEKPVMFGRMRFLAPYRFALHAPDTMVDA